MLPDRRSNTRCYQSKNMRKSRNVHIRFMITSLSLDLYDSIDIRAPSVEEECGHNTPALLDRGRVASVLGHKKGRAQAARGERIPGWSEEK